MFGCNDWLVTKDNTNARLASHGGFEPENLRSALKSLGCATSHKFKLTTIQRLIYHKLSEIS